MRRALSTLATLLVCSLLTACPAKKAEEPKPAAPPATTQATPPPSESRAPGSVPGSPVIMTPDLDRVINQQKKLRVGLEAEFKPFEYKTDKGELVGFDVDLANELGKELGVPVEFHETKWEGIIPDLLSSQYDIILSGMTDTAEREKSIAFSKSYYHTGLCLLLNKAKDAAVKKPEELDSADKTIVVKTGTTSDTWATQHFTKAKILRVSEENSAALEVSQGHADAMIYDQLSIKNHADEAPDTTVAVLDPFTSEPYAIGMRQEDTGLKARINDALDKINADGRMDRLYAKHFGNLPRLLK